MDIKTKMEFMDLLRQAIKSNEIDKVKDVLTREPELIRSKTRSGGTLLHDASAYGTLQMAELLLNMGIDITVESSFCGTALTCASTPEMAEFLMNHGMLPFLDIADKRNPLFFKISIGNGEKTKPMIKYWFNYEKNRLNEEEQKRLCDKVYEQLKIMANEKLLEELGFNNRDEEEARQPQDFDSEHLENIVCQCTKAVYKDICLKHSTEQIYAFSLANESSFTSLFYVANTLEELKLQEDDLESKYFEENWEIWEIDNKNIRNVNAVLLDLMNKTRGKKKREELKEQILDIFVECMKKLREEQYFGKDILLNVYVREYLDDQEMIKIYRELNNTEESNIYSKLMTEEL